MGPMPLMLYPLATWTKGSKRRLKVVLLKDTYTHNQSRFQLQSYGSLFAASLFLITPPPPKTHSKRGRPCPSPSSSPSWISNHQSGRSKRRLYRRAFSHLPPPTNPHKTPFLPSQIISIYIPDPNPTFFKPTLPPLTPHKTKISRTKRLGRRSLGFPVLASIKGMGSREYTKKNWSCYVCAKRLENE